MNSVKKIPSTFLNKVEQHYVSWKDGRAPEEGILDPTSVAETLEGRKGRFD